MALTGMTLARVEGTVALRAHFGRFPDLSLSGSPPRSGVINLSGLMVRRLGPNYSVRHCLPCLLMDNSHYP